MRATESWCVWQVPARGVTATGRGAGQDAPAVRIPSKRLWRTFHALTARALPKMAKELPYWILALQALSTPAIAFLAAVIGGMQWYTAHRRIVLDLYDRRIQVYSAVRAVVGKIISSGGATDLTLFEFDKGIDRASFLFDSDVTRYLKKLRDNLIDLIECTTMLPSNLSQSERAAYIKKSQSCKNIFRRFYTEGHAVFEPYLLMRQKAAPRWWLRLRNRA